MNISQLVVKSRGACAYFAGTMTALGTILWCSSAYALEADNGAMLPSVEIHLESLDGLRTIPPLRTSAPPKSWGMEEFLKTKQAAPDKPVALKHLPSRLPEQTVPLAPEAKPAHKPVSPDVALKKKAPGKLYKKHKPAAKTLKVLPQSKNRSSSLPKEPPLPKELPALSLPEPRPVMLPKPQKTTVPVKESPIPPLPAMEKPTPEKNLPEKPIAVTPPAAKLAPLPVPMAGEKPAVKPEAKLPPKPLEKPAEKPAEKEKSFLDWVPFMGKEESKPEAKPGIPPAPIVKPAAPLAATPAPLVPAAPPVPPAPLVSPKPVPLAPAPSEPLDETGVIPDLPAPGQKPLAPALPKPGVPPLPPVPLTPTLPPVIPSKLPAAEEKGKPVVLEEKKAPALPPVPKLPEEPSLADDALPPLPAPETFRVKPAAPAEGKPGNQSSALPGVPAAEEDAEFISPDAPVKNTPVKKADIPALPPLPGDAAKTDEKTVKIASLPQINQSFKENADGRLLRLTFSAANDLSASQKAQLDGLANAAIKDKAKRYKIVGYISDLQDPSKKLERSATLNATRKIADYMTSKGLDRLRVNTHLSVIGKPDTPNDAQGGLIDVYFE